MSKEENIKDEELKAEEAVVEEATGESPEVEELPDTPPNTTVEVLTPDFKDRDGAIETVTAARPDVFNHNLETVPRLYPAIRPGARG